MFFKPKKTKAEKPAEDGVPAAETSQGTGNKELDEAIEIAGYLYDPTQDIFFSNMDPWQRRIGYCRLYDEAAAVLGMIVDCEPIYFNYNRKRWVIELWKGQYDLVTGCEIGVYTAALGIPGVAKGAFYTCANDAELLQMSYTLKKNGNTLFSREGVHWWLTGFKLGEFSEPSELTMDVNITLQDEPMRDAFIIGLDNAGYTNDKFAVSGNTVSFTFSTPHTRQPFTRMAQTDRIIQRKNQTLCNLYQEITGPYGNIQDKIKAMEEQAPEIYKRFANIGKSKKTFELFAAAAITGTLLLSCLTIVRREVKNNRKHNIAD